MTYHISGQEPLADPPCDQYEGAFQKALCQEMEAMRRAIIQQINEQQYFLRAWWNDPGFQASLAERREEERQRKIEKWGEKRVRAKGIGLRIARTWEGPRLTILPEEEVDPW
jgi:hypothetical protein